MASSSIKEFCETYIKYKNWKDPEEFNPSIRKPYFTLNSNEGMFNHHHLELGEVIENDENEV